MANSSSSARVAERCWVLVGQRCGRIWRAKRVGRSMGGPSRVEFDAAAVLAREEHRRDVVGFLHTHPGMSAAPSGRDVDTTRAWSSAFGKPLLCLIRGATGLAGYRFDDDQSRGEPLMLVEAFKRAVVIGVDADAG